MYSPKKYSSFNKYSFYRETSSYSSHLQTETSSRISRSDLKKINTLKKTMNAYTNLSRNYKSNLTNLYYVKSVNLTNNFIYPYIKDKNYNNIKKINNIKHIKEEKKIRTRNGYNKISLNDDKNKNKNIYYTYNKDLMNYKERLKIKEPLYRYKTPCRNSFIDFQNDSRNLRYLKINSYNGKKAVERLNENLIYNKQISDLGDINREKTAQLLKIYGESLYFYISYLNTKLNEESVISYHLLNEKNLLINEIVKLKKKINKIIMKYEGYLDQKYFLICIKELSNDYKKFPKETQIDILYDLYKYYIYKKVINDESLNYNIINNKKKEDNSENFFNFINIISQNLNSYDLNKRIMFLNYILISLDMNNFFNIFSNINHSYIISHKIKNIFNNTDEYENKMNKVFHQNLSSLDIFNKLNKEIYNLRSELNEEIKNKKKEIPLINSLKEKANILEGKLNILKTHYFNNLNEYNLLKKGQKEIENNSKVLNKKINNIANNIKNCILPNIIPFKTIKTYKEKNQPITIIEKMNYCERVLIFLLNYKKEQAISNEDNYNKVIKEVKKEELINKFKNKEETMRKIMALKTKKIIEKNNKILFLNHRKIDEKKIIKK